MEIKLPSGANPQNVPCSINPYDKHKRHKGLNYKEYSEFSGICTLSNDQIIECYSIVDKEIIPEEFKIRCSNCPYAREHSRTCKTHLTNIYPYFIDKIIDVEYDNPKDYVYFISDGEFVKIGVAENPKKRLLELQVGNARKLNIICQIPTKSKKDAHFLEKHLHYEYAAFAKNGEWFNILNHILVEEFRKYFK